MPTEIRRQALTSFCTRLQEPRRFLQVVAGPRQVGKSTLVRAFATALFCTGEAKPCGHCRSCTLMAHGSHSDYHTVAPMDGGDPPKIDRITGKLYQEQAENLVADAWLRPFEGAHKLFHIQDAQRATTDRFDVVVSALALHHVEPEDRDAVFAEAFRMLIPGGRLLVAEWRRRSISSLMEESFSM